MLGAVNENPTIEEQTWHYRKTDMWNSVEDKPKSGSRIIALFADGSGAHLFIVVDGDGEGALGLIDVDGDECSYDGLLEHYSSWAYLPDGTKLWCEQRSDEPVQMKF